MSEEKDMMDRITIINALKACENSIREIRQSLEAEERGEFQDYVLLERKENKKP